MRKTKKIISILIILCMAISLMPLQVFAIQGYTLTFTVSGEHTITSEGRTGEIIVDGTFVNFKDGNNEAIGVATVAQDGKSATIYISDGTEGSISYGDDHKFSLLVGGNPYTFGTKLSADTQIAVQDYVEQQQGGQAGSIIPVQFDNASEFSGNTITFMVGNPNTLVSATVQFKSNTAGEMKGQLLEIERNELNNVEFELSNNFNPETMGVYVSGANNYNAELPVANLKATFSNINLPDGEVRLRIGLKADNQNPGGQGEETGPQPTEYTVDFGNATWEVKGETVTASINGKEIKDKGSITIGVDERIILTGFNEKTMQASVTVREDGFSTKLKVDKNNDVYETCIANKYAESLYDGSVLDFVIERRTNDGPENNLPAPNTTATVTISSSSSENKSYVNSRIGINGYGVEIPEVKEGKEIPSSTTIENFGYFYDEENDNGQVTINCSALFINKYVGTVTINGNPYAVSDFINYEDRNDWLEHYDHQTVGFDIKVDKADNYNIVCDLDDMEGKDIYIGNFLWTDAEENKNDDNYIGHSILEVVKVEYEIENPTTGEWEKTVVEEDDLENDSYIEYYPYGEVGSLVVPEGAKCTMRIIPEYGYQVTSFGINGSDIETGDNISEFTFPIHKGNFHLGAKVTKVADEVNAKSEKVKSGTIKLGGKEIDAGSVVLSVDDVELSEEQISNFEETAEGYTISSYLNINLDQVIYKGTADDVWSNELRNLNNEATITLKLEEGVNGNEVVIVHEKHDGTYEIIPTTYDEETHTITFKTKSFSNYAIASKTTDEENQEKEDDQEIKQGAISPKTGDNIILWIVLAVISTLGVIATVKNIKK